MKICRYHCVLSRIGECFPSVAQILHGNKQRYGSGPFM
jgi:hypothetical protein